jgi:hypothetical protein
MDRYPESVAGHDFFTLWVQRQEAGIPIDAFLAAMPYTVEQLLDDDFIP